MKKYLSHLSITPGLMSILFIASCSDDKDDPKSEIDSTHEVTVGFQNVSPDLIGGPTSYGANLYFGAPDQITKGYLAEIANNIYAQFGINFGYTFDDATPVGYTFYSGGIAVSDWHEMTIASYENQLSVYSKSSPSDGNFVVAFGASLQSDPSQATLADYNECGRIYITDAAGFTPTHSDEAFSLNGTINQASFKSVFVNNTTYTYLTMREGNPYASALNEENQGWFKVQFISFDSNEPTAKPTGCVEAYLANFNDDIFKKIGYKGIIDEWFEVDLSSLPKASIIVVNFAGSDTSEWGLNTPKYCAMDNFVISVE